MNFEKAVRSDITELTSLRVAYLKEDNGEMDKSVLQSIENDLPDYFVRHLERDMIVYVARNKQEIVACAMLLVIEKPMSPAFITGKTGTVLNVYTRPEHRKKGYARRLMKMLLDDAADKNLSYVELKATEEGYNLYKAVGFEDVISKYCLMKWKNPGIW